jgi:hypothetical protein
VKHRLSNNVGGVKHSRGALARALRRARHFALVEAFAFASSFALPTKARRFWNCGNNVPQVVGNPLAISAVASAIAFGLVQAILGAFFCGKLVGSVTATDGALKEVVKDVDRHEEYLRDHHRRDLRLKPDSLW